MNPAYSSQNPFPHQPHHGQGINPSALMGQAGGINPSQLMGGGMGGGMGPGMNMGMMGGNTMNPQLMGGRGMMNGGNLNAMGNMGGMGGPGMGGGGMGGSMGGGGMNIGMGGGMGINGVGNPMANGGGMGGPSLPNMMPSNMGDGMSMQRPGTSMGSGPPMGPSFGNQFGGQPGMAGGGGGPASQMSPQQQQQFNMLLSTTNITREQYMNMAPPERQMIHERMNAKLRERQMMQMSGGMPPQQPQPPSQNFQPSFGNERSPSVNPSMMPPPPPNARPGTSMSMRRAPSMEHMRPPSAMGGFSKSGMQEQSPTGNAYPQPSPVNAQRMPGSPRMDGIPNAFASSSSNALASPTRPMSSASNSSFVKTSTPGRMPSISRAATATPTNLLGPVDHSPLHTSFGPPRSTPTPAPARVTTPANNTQSPSRATSSAPAPHTPSTSGPGSASGQPSAVAHRLPPLPPGLNKAVTQITNVPLKDSLKLIPEMSEKEIGEVKDWMKIDKEYEKTYLQMRERMEKEREALGKRWWERGGGAPGGLHLALGGRQKFDIKYPGGRARKDTRTKSKVERREGLKLPRKIDPQRVDVPEELVPIRLEFDVEQHQRMRDTFVWNLNDPIVTPEAFAQSVVEDYKLGPNYHTVIVKAIQDQLADYKAHSTNYDGEAGTFIGDVENVPIKKGVLDAESSLWWKKWRKRLRTEDFSFDNDNDADFVPKRRRVLKSDVSMSVDEFRVNETETHEEMRILVKLDIIVGSTKLEDQFEWDMDNDDASPEAFAEVYVSELGIASEFKTAISHSIREQVQMYQKSLFLVGHPSDGTAIQDDELKASFLPSVTSAARPVGDVQSFMPLLNYLSDGEIDRHEKERDKDMNKRKKRNTRGRRGVALPERDAIRTYRTPAIGFPPPDPAVLALQAAANAPTSRRAAAAAASLSIANMVASENGGSPLMGNASLPMPPPQQQYHHQQPQPQQPVQPPAPPKEKKPKHLYKAPIPPASVIRPRAHVVAPTASTAVDDGTGGSNPRRTKEMERDAKEREFIDGQRPNMINGVWHCSNCGCPESIAFGRRKGPLGFKTQCGTCGKFWHRHRRPRPVEYNTNPEAHMPGSKVEPAKTPSRRKGRTNAATPVSEAQTPRNKHDDDYEMAPSRLDNALSPVSTASSVSEAPLSRAKTNGSGHHPPQPPKSPTPETKGPSSPTASGANSNDPPLSPSAQRAWPPEWLGDAMQNIQSRYPHDKFELALRKVSPTSEPKWRIKCLDCPGKLYKPGPEETLSNFEVHLRYNGHRKVVEKRISGS